MTPPLIMFAVLRYRAGARTRGCSDQYEYTETPNQALHLRLQFSMSKFEMISIFTVQSTRCWAAVAELEPRYEHTYHYES